MKFYVGLHHPGDAKHFERAFISINCLRTRRLPIEADEWILDSGAFTEISKFGKYRDDESVYASHVNRLAAINPNLLAAVSQDYMCEAFILNKTGLSIADHQRLTIERYDRLTPSITTAYLMPVLQGYEPKDYVAHILAYGKRLPVGAYVGVGSVCKRNDDIGKIEAVMRAIKNERPDLRLHGFGLKTTALSNSNVRDRLYSADSMAWSWAARKEGRDPNSWVEAKRFSRRIERQAVQLGMEF